jgi:hypothetical protein
VIVSVMVVQIVEVIKLLEVMGQPECQSWWCYQPCCQSMNWSENQTSNSRVAAHRGWGEIAKIPMLLQLIAWLVEASVVRGWLPGTDYGGHLDLGTGKLRGP